MNFSVDDDTCRRLIVSSSLNGYEHLPGQQKIRSSSTVMGYIFLRSVHTTPIILLYSYLHMHVGKREEKREKKKKYVIDLLASFRCNLTLKSITRSLLKSSRVQLYFSVKWDFFPSDWLSMVVLFERVYMLDEII